MGNRRNLLGSNVYVVHLTHDERATLLILLTQEMRENARQLNSARELGNEYGAQHYRTMIQGLRQVFDKVHGNALADS